MDLREPIAHPGQWRPCRQQPRARGVAHQPDPCAVEDGCSRCYRMHLMSTEKITLEQVDARSLETLRLFPLPDTVLFPGTVLPLHVFEHRYRTLVGDALQADRLLAVALLKSGPQPPGGEPSIHPVVGVGRIVHHQRLSDGRYHIALQGVCRAAITRELPTDTLYRVASARMLPDQLPEGGEEELVEPLNTLRVCFLRLLSRLPDRAASLLELLDHVRAPGLLADVLCAAALESADARQLALSTTSVLDRLNLATEALADLMLKIVPEEETRDLPV